MSATPEVGPFLSLKTQVHETDRLDVPPMNTYPAQPAYRLGKHFEDCVERLFESSSTNNISSPQPSDPNP